jgi:hypothetical protein
MIAQSYLNYLRRAFSRNFERAVARPMGAIEGASQALSLYMRVASTDRDIPAYLTGEYYLLNSTNESSPAAVTALLACGNYIPNGRGTGDALSKYLKERSTYGRMACISILGSSPVLYRYYIGHGMILNNDKEPLLLASRSIEVGIKNITGTSIIKQGDFNLHVSPRVYDNSNPMEEAIRRKLIPAFMEMDIENMFPSSPDYWAYGKKPEKKLIIGDSIDSFFFRPTLSHPTEFSNDEIGDWLEEHSEEIIDNIVIQE